MGDSQAFYRRYYIATRKELAHLRNNVRKMRDLVAADVKRPLPDGKAAAIATAPITHAGLPPPLAAGTDPLD
jgi:hypothetical protein